MHEKLLMPSLPIVKQINKFILQECMVVPICYGTNVDHEFFQEDQGNHGLTNMARTANGQFGFLHQLHFHNPMAIYMELWFSEAFSLASFGIKLDCGCKYVLQIKFLLQMLYSSFTFIYIEKYLLVSWMLSWLHWKYDYT
jgi:hypothetical protein